VQVQVAGLDQAQELHQGEALPQSAHYRLSGKREAAQFRVTPVFTPQTGSRKAGVMRKVIYGMNVTLDGYIAAPGDDISWSGPPSDELFQWWLDQERASGLSLYGRKLWQTMSAYWPTGDQRPNATPAEIEFARNWRDTPKVVFSSTIDKVDWNTRLFTGDPVAEITRLKAEDGGPMQVGGATLAGAVMRAGLIDEYALATVPILVGGGTPLFTALDRWVSLNLVETRTFPGGVVLTRYETRR
jgi:dihydrofolate reductase